MDPSKRRRRRQLEEAAAAQEPAAVQTKQFGEETEEDREKAIADAERKNLWDATEVIDMDNW